MRARLTIRNRSRYPDEEVRRLVRLGLSESERDGLHVCVNVKNATRGTAGGCFYEYIPSISNAPRSADHLITLALGPEDAFPGGWHSQPETAPRLIFADWREALVATAAHEGRHLTQARLCMAGRREVDADIHAAGILRRYREGTL